MIYRPLRLVLSSVKMIYADGSTTLVLGQNVATVVPNMMMMMTPLAPSPSFLPSTHLPSLTTATTTAGTALGTKSSSTTTVVTPTIIGAPPPGRK